MARKPYYAGDGTYPGSYYAASANIKRMPKVLEGEETTEICVVGAGYSGLSTAIHLAESGHKVTLVEGARVGWGASGRNGGQIVNGLNASLETIEKRYGAGTAGFIGQMLQEGAQTIYRLVETYKIDCDLKRGNIYTAYSKRHMHELEAQKVLWERHGMNDHELLDKAALRTHLGSDVYIGGMIDHSGGHMHPLNLALGEAAAFESLGGLIHELSPVTGIDQSGARPVVRTDRGRITADVVILCGNAYLGHVAPELTQRVLPVSTQMVATTPLSEAQAQDILPTGKAIEDTRYILDYFRLSADRRLLFGGGVVYGGTDPADIEAKIRPNLEKVFPQLKGVGIAYKWSGNFALSFSRVPQMGRLGANVYFAHGYSGHGVTGTHLFGKILAEAVNNDLSRFDTFASLPWYPFPGGRMFGAQYSTIGSWWYQFRDAVGL